MTHEQATDTIYQVAAKQGEPLTRDVAETIARQLFPSALPINREPGYIAKYRRERYETETNQEVM